MPAATLVSITGPDIPANFLGDYAARGLTMSLTHIDAAKRMRRTINGELKDVSRVQFRKYRVTIQCTDHESPPFADVPPGTEAVVVCLPELGTTGKDNTPGAAEVLTLTTRFADWSVQRDEYQAQTGWSLILDEI